MQPKWIRTERVITPDQLPGVYAEIAELFGVEAAYQLAERYGGTQVYFPRLTRDHLKRRNRAIYNLYNQGATVAQLAKKYELSNSWIHAIIADEEAAVNQLLLYDEEPDNEQLDLAMNAD